MSRLNRLLLSTTCFAGMLAMPAMAQEADSQEVAAASQVEDSAGGGIIVTGSRITRPNTTAAAPVTSVTSDAIRAQAAVNIEEVLNRVPQIAPDSQQNYQDSDGRQRIKLRNLGFERTLTLVDGKRLGTMNGVDANMIPTALIERVDVLTGGASAVYGSDAIAGVVNFVMKPDFSGVQLNANYNFYAHQNKPGLISEVASQYGFAQPNHDFVTDGGRVDLSMTAGTKLFDDRLRVSGYVNYRKASLVPYGARETSGCQLQQSAKDGPLSCTQSTYTPNGYVSPRFPTSPNNQYPEFVNNPDGSGTLVPFSSAYAANPYDGYSFQRENERWNAGGFASFEVSDALEFYGNLMWFRDESRNPFPARVLSYTAYGTTPYTIRCDNPFLSASQAQTVCGASAGTSAAVPIELRYRMNDAAPIDDSYLNEGLRVAAGARGNFAEGWSYDIGGVYARNQADWTWGRANFDRVNNALDVVSNNGVISCRNAADGCVPFDPFTPNSAVNGQALSDYIMVGGYGTQRTINTLYNVLATVQGDLGTYGIKSPWADEGVAVAFGAEYREDQLNSSADARWRQLAGGRDQDLSQNVWEGMVEVQAPIMQRKPFAELLQLNGAYRLSKYSSNSNTFSTWKAEALWAPISDITFRASINRAQRAPTVVQAYQASNVEYSRVTTEFSDFCAPTVTVDDEGNRTYGAPVASREVCAATGLADNLYGSTTLLCGAYGVTADSQQGCTRRTGDFEVRPETAYTKTFGLVLKPSFLRGLVLSVDRFLIDLKDSIGYNDYAEFQNGCLATADQFFCSAFVRNPDGTLYSPTTGNAATGFIRAGSMNNYKSKSHGWDFSGVYNLGLGSAGRLDFDFAGSLTTYAGGQDTSYLPAYDCAGYYGGSCGQLIPKWTHTLRTTYTTADQFFSASLNWRHLSPLTNVSNSGDPALGWKEGDDRTTFYRIEAYDYFDLALNFRVNKAYSFRISANNILDKTPPILANSYSYGLSRSNTLSARYDSLGRQIAVGATVNF